MATENGRSATNVVAFFALAYLIAWAMWLPLLAAGVLVRQGWWPTHFPGLLAPAVAAMLVTAWREGMSAGLAFVRSALRWRPTIRELGIALSPLGFLVVALPAARLIDGHWIDPSEFGHFSGLPSSIGPIGVVLALVIVNGLGEEMGWRGFAMPRLQARFGALPGIMLLTVGWAAWHAPLFGLLASYKGFSVALVPAFLFSLGCGAVILAWVYYRTGGSIWACAVWHALYNVASGTDAAQGTVAVIVSTLVVVQAVGLVSRHLRTQHAGTLSPLGPREVSQLLSG